MTAAEEKEVLKRAKHGELSAFETLITAYEKRVFALAYRACGNEEDARDLTQEIFLRMYRSLDSFKGESRFSTWLYRVAANICIDFNRKASTTPKTASLEDGEAALRLPDQNQARQPEAAAENLELRAELQAGLAALSQEHRTVLLLRDVSGLTYGELAQALDLTEGTVKSRLARARRALREILLQRGNIQAPGPSKKTERGTAR